RVDLTPAEDRLAVVRAAVADVPGLEASAVEVEREGPTYTADTLAGLSASGDQLFLIVGADVAGLLDTRVRPAGGRELGALVVDGGVRPASPGSLGDRGARGGGGGDGAAGVAGRASGELAGSVVVGGGALGAAGVEGGDHEWRPLRGVRAGRLVGRTGRLAGG